MKRLLAQIGISYFSVLAIAFYLSEKATWIILSGSAVAAVVLLIIRRTRKTVFVPAIALTVALGCAVNLGYTYLHVIPIQDQFSGSERHIEATLTDEPYLSYSKYYYRLTAETIDGDSADCKLLLKTSHPLAIDVYDTISFTADVHVTDNNYYLTKGYYLTVNTYEDTFNIHENATKPLFHHVIRLRQSLRTALDAFLPGDVADLCKAIFVGDKYALDTGTKMNFRYAGASYFVVVSGMHFSIICLLIYRLLKKQSLHRFVPVAITLPVILLYMSVTGFQPSVVRSGVMMTVYVIAQAIRRINDPHSSLGLAGIISATVFSPYGAGDIGLILSFAATFAILTWSEPIYQRLSVKEPVRRYQRGYNAFIRTLSASLAANILVFPISVFVFRAFSSVTLISAILLNLPVEMILILSLFLCILFPLGPLRYVSLILSWPLYVLGRFVLLVVEGLSSLPFSYVYIGHNFFFIWMGVTVVLGLLVIALRKRYHILPYAAILSAILLIGGTVVNAVINLNTVQLTAYACGGGLTVGLDYHGSLYMLSFDSGSYDAYRILNTLSEDYHSAELAVCSRKHDLVNYSRLSDKEFAVDRYLLYDAGVSYDGSAELIAYDEADTYLLDDGVTLTVSEYNGKLLSYLTVGDASVLVIPQNYPYQEIPDEFRSADIIILSYLIDGYHGLSCDTLIVSNTNDNAPAIAEEMKDRCRAVLCTGSDNITIPMEG